MANTTTTALKPVLDEDALYLGDNGAVLCGRHSGASARFSGRDLSGHPVEKITEAILHEEATASGESLAAVRAVFACESCGRKVEG